MLQAPITNHKQLLDFLRSLDFWVYNDLSNEFVKRERWYTWRRVWLLGDILVTHLSLPPSLSLCGKCATELGVEGENTKPDKYVDTDISQSRFRNASLSLIARSRFNASLWA